MRNAVSLKPKPFGLRLRVHADHRVDLFRIAVDAREVGGVLRRVGHLLERVVRLQVQEPPELVVARHAALTHAQHVDRRQVDERAVGLVEVLQVLREVVQRDRARVHRPERVERVGHRHLRQPFAHVQHADLGQRALLQQPVVVERAEAEVVGDQRVHAVDGDELLGQLVRHAVQRGRRAGDAADHLVRGAAPDQAVEPAALEPPPVRAQGGHRRRVGDDRRRPVDGVDLRHQRRDDEARLVEQLVVGELWDASRAGGRRRRCARA